METQADMKMAQRELQEEKTNNLMEEITEEQFLKNLYLFMKKRDTPIERIPNLGFKQIDLFIMFKTVNDLGGYHQVTSHQLWKQVYNTLGGNPRSTSAATCTRRHYEKLLLPYECHVKGILISSIPQLHQPKPYHYSEDDEGGQRPSKRRLMTLQLRQQGSHSFLSDPSMNFYPRHLHYPHYYHPNNTVLPQYFPMSPSRLTPHSSTVTKPQFPVQPPRPDSTKAVKEPLQLLRDLAEQYKSTTGLVEPLNLSVKASARESNSNPVSSFSPPSSSKNPKFLNKPSTLYAPGHGGVPTNEGCETEDGESSGEATAFSCPVKREAEHGIDIKAQTSSSSPVYEPALTLDVDKDMSEMRQKHSFQKMDFEIRPPGNTEAISGIERFSLSHILQSRPQQKDGNVEIEVPLSVFCNWLKSCQSSASMPVVKEPPDHEETVVRKNWSELDNLPIDLTPQSNRNDPNPTSSPQTTSHQPSYRQNPFPGNKSLPSGGILNNASKQNLWSFDQQNTDRSIDLTSPDLWDKEERHASSTLGKCDSGPVAPQQNFASEFYGEKAVCGGTHTAKIVPSYLLKLNSNSANALHVREELMKLKRIISS